MERAGASRKRAAIRAKRRAPNASSAMESATGPGTVPRRTIPIALGASTVAMLATWLGTAAAPVVAAAVAAAAHAIVVTVARHHDARLAIDVERSYAPGARCQDEPWRGSIWNEPFFFVLCIVFDVFVL